MQRLGVRRGQQYLCAKRRGRLEGRAGPERVGRGLAGWGGGAAGGRGTRGGGAAADAAAAAAPDLRAVLAGSQPSGAVAKLRAPY